VPHNKEANHLNIRLREDILSLAFFDRVVARFDKQEIEYLGLWGGEPTLNLDVFSTILTDSFISDYFPNLKNIHFSTNLSKSISLSNIYLFLEAVKKLEKPLTISIQTSIDGPAFLHDIHRRGSEVSTVLSNLENLQGQVQTLYPFVTLTVKPTYSGDEYVLLSSNSEYLEAVFAFSDYLRNRGHRYGVTSAIPGRYTVKDGKAYGVFTQKVLDRGYSNFSEIYDLVQKLFQRVRDTKYHSRRPDLLTAFSFCSAGNSSLAIDNTGAAHLCQGTFLSMLGEEMRIDSPKDKLEKVGLSFDKTALRTAISPANTSALEEQMYSYVIRAVTRTALTTMNYTKSFLKILAISNQLSPIYKEDEDMLNLLAPIVIFGKYCINSNLLTTGAFELHTGSLAKLYGNGALEAALSHHLKQQHKKENA